MFKSLSKNKNHHKLWHFPTIIAPIPQIVTSPPHNNSTDSTDCGISPSIIAPIPQFVAFFYNNISDMTKVAFDMTSNNKI